MYHATKKLTTITALLCAFNIFAFLMFLLYFPDSGMQFTMIITVVTYLVTTSLTSLLLTIALRKLCENLDFNFEKDSETISDIKKRLKRMENSVK